MIESLTESSGEMVRGYTPNAEVKEVTDHNIAVLQGLIQPKKAESAQLWLWRDGGHETELADLCCDENREGLDEVYRLLGVDTEVAVVEFSPIKKVIDADGKVMEMFEQTVAYGWGDVTIVERSAAVGSRLSFSVTAHKQPGAQK